jgi:hypothetical protein
VEGRAAFTKMLLGALDIVGHDVCDGCTRVALVVLRPCVGRHLGVRPYRSWHPELSIISTTLTIPILQTHSVQVRSKSPDSSYAQASWP